MKTMWSHSELPVRAIADNRNGQLSRYLESVRKELDYACEVEVPQTDGNSDLCALKRYLMDAMAER
jgi:hypothetical protein